MHRWRKNYRMNEKSLEELRTDILESDGWTRQFIANEPRLSESVEAYEEAGFEVHLEPLPKKTENEKCEVKGDSEVCRACFEGFEDQYKIIFTRPKDKSTKDDDDLF